MARVRRRRRRRSRSRRPRAVPAGLRGRASSRPRSPGFEAADPDPLGEIEKATGLDVEAGPRLDRRRRRLRRRAPRSSASAAASCIETTTSRRPRRPSTGSASALEPRARRCTITPTDTGFDITIRGAPVGAEVAVEDGKVVFAGRRRHGRRRARARRDARRLRPLQRRPRCARRRRDAVLLPRLPADPLS